MARSVQRVKVVPAKFHAALKDKGLTLKSLSAEMGYSASWIRAEEGSVPLAAINYLKKVYEVDPSSFVVADDATQVIDPVAVMTATKVAVRDAISEVMEGDAFRTFLMQAAKRGAIEYVTAYRETIKAMVVEAVKEAINE